MAMKRAATSAIRAFSSSSPSSFGSSGSSTRLLHASAESKKIVGVFYKANEYASLNPNFVGSLEGALGIRDWLESQGHQYIVTDDKEGLDSELEKHIPDLHVLITTPFHPAYVTEERIKRAKNLQLLLTAGIGSDHIDLKAAADAGLTVAEVTGSNVVSVAEDELMRILMLVRNFLPGYHQVINGEWNVAAIAYRAYDLEGKTVGTVGAGRIGRLLLQRLKPFNCNLLYHDRIKMEPELEKQTGAKFEEDLDSMLSKCDIVANLRLPTPLYMHAPHKRVPPPPLISPITFFTLSNIQGSLDKANLKTHSRRPLFSHMGSLILEALNVRVEGQGDKFLVFAHGFGTDQSAWQRILPFFTPYYRVILFDLVCAGSVNPDYFNFRRYTNLEAYVDDLLNILDTLGVDRCFYVGHSVSAMIGILASIRRPELFTKLIMIGASPRFLNDKDYHGGFEQEEIESVFVAMEANYEAWVNGFAPLAVGADVPAAVREFSRTLFNMRPDITLFVSRTVFNSDLRGILGLVKVPCCIIQTSKDVSVPASVAKYLKNHLGGKTTVEMLRTEGHLPHLSAPAMLAPVIRRALSR